jgi:F-type H+-transporting ATPase subunit gamma
MASLQGIKRRIRSVSNTRQITKAMQMVEASKLRKAQATALGPQAYTDAARALLARLGGTPVANLSPLFQKRPVKNALTIVVAADRGMAGAYNGNVLKALGRHVHDLAVSQSAIAIGRRAAVAVARASDVTEVASYGIDHGDADTAIARPVLEEVTRLYVSGEVDAVHLIYTHFVSTVKYEVITKQLLPVVSSEAKTGEGEMEPDPSELLDYAARRVIEADIVQAVLEARASENASRMMAMMNATDNANDLIADYTLAFNNARQASITQEIAEISGGAQAITQ